MSIVEKVNLINIPVGPWFDDLDHISMAVKSLATFRHLQQCRRDYRELKVAPLHDYVVGGIWNLDHYGQLGIRTIDYNGQEPPKAVVNFLEDTKKYMRAYETNHFMATLRSLGFTGFAGFAFGGTQRLPTEHEKCKVCGKGWEPSNSDDCRRHGEEVTVEDLSPSMTDMFIGLTIDEINEVQLMHEGSVMQLDRYNPFKNRKYVDLTVVNEMAQPRHENLAGWMSTHYSDEKKPYYIDAKTYKMQKGDIPCFEYQPVAHKACSVMSMNDTIKVNILKCFKDAGVTVDGVIPMPNQYLRGEHHSLWYLISVSGKYYQVGWRRHVMSFMEMDTDHEYDHLNFKQVGEESHFDTFEELTKHLKEKG